MKYEAHRRSSLQERQLNGRVGGEAKQEGDLQVSADLQVTLSQDA